MCEKRPKKLLDQMRAILRIKHYAISTEDAYVQWIIRFIHFHNMRHPQEMDTPEVEAFLTHLAVDKNLAASTQNQAFSAILFLYRNVLHQDLQAPIDALRAKKSQHLPTVLTRDEVWRVIDRMSDTPQLIATLLYGTGMRLMEGLRLRVKDIDFAQRQIIVRNGKGAKDRMTVLPDRLQTPLRALLKEVEAIHHDDLAKGYGAVYLPYALERKYPNANREWIWQYLFPSHKLAKDPRSGLIRAITLAKVSCKKQTKRPYALLTSINPPAVTPSATASPLTSWRMAMISALFKSCWGMKSWKRP